MGDHYDVSGKGMCIIIANFVGPKKGESQHLEGYMADVKNLKDCFKKKPLNYTVITDINNEKLRNLSSKQFRSRMCDLQVYLNQEWERHSKGKKYDRLFVFVLSHGSEKGLAMCKEGSDGASVETDKGGSPVYISTDEVISYFTHDMIPPLKDKPKCFFFQACRGTSRSQVASLGGPGHPEKSETDLVSNDRMSSTGADILVAYCTLKDSSSSVSNTKGSAFISHLVKVLQKKCDHGKTTDIYHILTEVMNKMKKTSVKTFIWCNDPEYDIRVLRNGRFCPIKICSKMEEDYRPLFAEHVNDTNRWQYTRYSSLETVEMNVQQHNLSGSVWVSKTNEKTGEKVLEEGYSSQDWNLELLQVFKAFSIKGTLKERQHNNVLAVGEVKVDPNSIHVGGYLKTLEDAMGRSQYWGLIEQNGRTETYKAEDILNEQGQLYVNDKLVGTGKILKIDDVYGMKATTRQMPTFSSTLTKTLHIIQPSKQTKKEEDGTLLRQLKDIVKNYSSKNESSETEKTDESESSVTEKTDERESSETKKTDERESSEKEETDERESSESSEKEETDERESSEKEETDESKSSEKKETDESESSETEDPDESVKPSTSHPSD